MANDNSQEFRTGAALLAHWGCFNREQKLEQACKALMAIINEDHETRHGQDLAKTLDDPNVFCSCADAYRMGHEALKPEQP